MLVPRNVSRVQNFLGDSTVVLKIINSAAQ